jgi:hypothetical protein
MALLTHLRMAYTDPERFSSLAMPAQQTPAPQAPAKSKRS